ncbi:sulfite exporter TauE/SafE family protein [Alteromonas sp. CI.11.F.A3]|uniref:sulfite exporter TauE/SafE family protein n=1 Tax=Alteromonas sp. CI.11.F.A3 TaxID=3079555 RepID=UPI002943ED3A|nr:sulfite exporter TauE/SafE family protein [Alteromonas sp. CI.11.F.A3]WOI37842.1 sulfite exporter TauE/SafE family protein [Alteromonas sp. CI.11.F.A3]
MDLVTYWLTANGAISLTTAAVLIATSTITSLITATFGIGGGVLLIAVMAGSLPVSALIPVHGLVQLGSNGNRALMTFRYIDWSMVKFFSFGALLGAVLATFIVVQLPLVVIQFAVAGFILFLVWGSKPKAQEMQPAGRSLAGLITTLISMFVGATGPLVAAFVHRNNYNKMQITATMASCLTFQHGLKAFVFTFVGFSFFQWLGLIFAMIISGAVGTYVGLKVLKKIPADKFLVLFKVIVTLLAIRLIVQAVFELV